MPSGYIFVVNNSLMDEKNKNKYLNEILSKSIIIKREINYSILKLK